jgi:transcriptional regulator with GAF, ATPase, and Fis domain
MLFDAVSRHTNRVLSLSSLKRHIFERHKDMGPEEQMEQQESAYLRFPKELPTIKESTRLLVAEAMKRGGGNQSLAAKLLGITQQALSKRLKKEKQEAEKLTGAG